MESATGKRKYRPTESKYKGGAKEMYITYELEQRTRSGTATYPKVKRVYIAGNVTDWKAGTVQKRTGRKVRGVRIEYEQSRARYRRRAYKAERGGDSYEVSPASIGTTSQRFVQVVEVPEAAHDVQFHPDASDVPQRYRHAIQHVR